MGVVLSRIWGSSGVKYVGDSTTGLTAEEKALLADSFSYLKQDLTRYGIEIFTMFFEDYPQHKKYFRDFKDKTVEELEGDPKLAAHGMNVMNAFNGIILLLNEPESLAALVRKLGYNHARRNIDEQALRDLKTLFAKFLKVKLKSKCTPQILDVWAKALELIIIVFKEGEAEYHKDNDK